MKYNDIIILGAKPIKGMKSLGPLAEIEIYKKKRVLDVQMHNLRKKLAIDRIIFVGGFMGDRIEKDQDGITYIQNESYESKNNGYSLKLASKYLSWKNNIIILFNKTIFSYKIFNDLDSSSSYCFIDQNKKNSYKLGCSINNGYLNNIFYGLDNKLCGIYSISSGEISALKNLIDNTYIDNMFIFELINKIIDDGGRILPKFVTSKNSIFQLDSNTSLKKFTKYYAKNFSI